MAIELRTLGSVQLVAAALPEAHVVATQPKRFALLVYLALARPHGPQRRDNLLAMLWPEADQERGRQVLRQTLYLLRQALGADVLVSHGDEAIQIDRAQVTCDADRFEQAITAGQLAEALELYGGEFLHGFHVPDVSPDFEEWVAGERRRLNALAGTAAWTLAARAEADRNAIQALTWARRAVALDRDNEDAVKDLMRLHARLGDRLGAIQVYDEHARRLQRDFAMEPSAELVRLARELRAAAPAAPATPAPVAIPPTPSARAAPVPAASPTTRPGHSRAWLAAGIVALLLAAVAMARWRSGRTPDHAPLLAVGSIVEIVGGDSSVESPVAGDLLATSLARLHKLEVIPTVRLYDVQAQLRTTGSPSASILAAARQAGASQIVRGTLRRLAGGRLTMDGQILDLETGAVVQAFRAEGADLFELVDHATEAVAGLVGSPPPGAPIRDVTTGSLAAYRLYQEGLRALYVDGDIQGGQRLFGAALAEDSAFAMAAYYDFITANILGLPATDSLMRQANRLSERAPDRERLVIRYRIAHLTQASDAVALAETLSVRYPNDLDAQFARGALLQRAGRWADAARQFRRLIETDSLSLHLRSARCVACDAYVELWWTFVYGDSLAAAEALAREALRRQGTRDPILDLLAVALARQGKNADALAQWSALYDAAGSGGADLQRAWVALRRGDLSAAEDTLARLARSGSAGRRSEALWYLAIALRNQGRPLAALALPGVPASAIALFEAGRYRESVASSDGVANAVAREGSASLPKQLPWQLVHVATALAALRDTTRLSRIADSVEVVGARSNFGRDPPLHQYVRGLEWLARGDTARAAEAFRRSVWSWTDGYTRSNYELARALIVLHRPGDAIYPLQAALRGDLQSSNMYVTRTELREQLARAFAAAGARDSARAEYALVARAWEHAEPAFAARRAVAVGYLAGR